MRSRTALCDALASWATAGEAGCYRRVIQPSRCIAFAAGSVAVLPMLFRLSPAGIARCAFLLCFEDIAAKACVDRGLHLGRQGACGLPQFAARGFEDRKSTRLNSSH